MACVSWSRTWTTRTKTTTSRKPQNPVRRICGKIECKWFCKPIKGQSKTTKKRFCQLIHKNYTYWWQNLGSDYPVWKKLINLLRHGSLPRGNERAIEYWRIKDYLQGHFCVLSSLVWRKVEEQHGRRRRTQEQISVMNWFFRNNSVSPKSFRTQSYWSFITRQCRDSGRFLQVHLSRPMCNQFTFHQPNFEQQTDSILSVCGSDGKKNKDPDTIDLEAPRLAQYIHKSMEETSEYGVLGRHQTCSKERIEVLSDTIERCHSSRNTPSLLYPESCLDGNWRSHFRKYMCHLDLLRRFPWTMVGWRNLVQKLLDKQKELLDKQKVPNQPNQTQIQIMIERWDPLCAHKTRPVLRKSIHVLFMKKLWNMIDRETRCLPWRKSRARCLPNTFISWQQELQRWRWNKSW